MADYGIFSTVVATAGALVLTFSAMLINMLGRAGKWTWMVGEKSPAVPMLGAKVLGIVLIGITYLKADKDNADLFLLLASVLAIVAAGLIMRFNGLRTIHILQVPQVKSDGSHARDGKGQLISAPMLIGRERDMQDTARKSYEEAKRERGALSLADFVSGVGPYKADAIWDREYLAKLANKFQSMLMAIFMLVSVNLFIVALVTTRISAAS